MPRMTNGIGTWFCTAQFDAGWGWDDAVECAMFVYFPIWPRRVVHLLVVPSGSVAPETYQAIPLRWSDALVWHVFLRRWLAGFVGLGLFIIFMLVLVQLWPPPEGGNGAREWAVTKPILTPLAPCMVVAGLVGSLFLRSRTRRERDIRRVLGLHSLGTSDPMTWVDDDLARMPTSDALFGTATDAEAVPKRLLAGSWTSAIWAARLSAARENPTTGEALTDEVLHHPGVREALALFRRDRNCWASVMGAPAFGDQKKESPATD